MQYRHGDVAIVKSKRATGKPISHSGNFVLARGEATGHQHCISVADPRHLEVRKTRRGFNFVLKAEGTLTHQEHGALTIAPGTYDTLQEREVDWFAISTRTVDD